MYDSRLEIPQILQTLIYDRVLIFSFSLMLSHIRIELLGVLLLSSPLPRSPMGFERANKLRYLLVLLTLVRKRSMTSTCLRDQTKIPIIISIWEIYPNNIISKLTEKFFFNRWWVLYRNIKI